MRTRILPDISEQSRPSSTVSILLLGRVPDSGIPALRISFFFANKQNKLLDNRPIRNLIVNNLLVQDEYKGVRLFLNLLLKKTVWNKNWRAIIAGKPRCVQLDSCNRLNIFLEAFKPKTTS